MIMSLSNALETETLKWQFTTASVTRPTAWYIALHTADPTDTGTVGEVTTGTDSAYVRQAVTFATPTGDTALSNSSVAFTANSGATTHVVTWYSIWSASTSGTCYGAGQLPVPITRVASATLTFAPGDIAVTAD